MPLHEQPVCREPGEGLAPVRRPRLRIVGTHVVHQSFGAQTSWERCRHLLAHGPGPVHQIMRGGGLDSAFIHALEDAAPVRGAACRANRVYGTGRGGKMPARVGQAIRSIEASARQPDPVVVVQLDHLEQAAIAAQSAREAQRAGCVGR